MTLGLKVFADVMEGFIVYDVHEQCWAFQLCPSSCAERSVALAKLLLKSVSTMP